VFKALFIVGWFVTAAVCLQLEKCRVKTLCGHVTAVNSVATMVDDSFCLLQQHCGTSRCSRHKAAVVSGIVQLVSLSWMCICYSKGCAHIAVMTVHIWLLWFTHPGCGVCAHLSVTWMCTELAVHMWLWQCVMMTVWWWLCDMTVWWWLCEDDCVMMTVWWWLCDDDCVMIIEWWPLCYDDCAMMAVWWWLFDEYCVVMAVWWWLCDNVCVMMTVL